MRDNLAEMVQLAQAAGARVLLVGMRMPPNYGPRYSEGFAPRIPRGRKSLSCAARAVPAEKVALDPELMQADGMHPNARGEPLVLDKVWPDLLPLLKKNAQPGGSLMDRIWLKSYPPQVPAEIDPTQLRSLKQLLEKACARYAGPHRVRADGHRLTYRRLEELSGAFGAWLQHARSQRAIASPSCCRTRCSIRSRCSARYVPG